MKHLVTIKKSMKAAMVIILLIIQAPISQKAMADNNCCSCPATVAEVSEVEWETGSTAGGPETWPTVPRLVNHVTSELAAQRIWMISVFWEDNVLPSLMLMSEQLTAVAIKQAQIIGSFMDAKHQMETQQVFQKLRADAHKDYQPSVGMCEFGSGIKSLAASERKGEYTAFALAQRSQDRQLGNANTGARQGPTSDKKTRIDQFVKTYCDPADNNNGLSIMCRYEDSNGNTMIGGPSAERLNRDIDYVRLIAQPKTLEVDFTQPGDPTPHEEDIFALASNLYGHDVFTRMNAEKLENNTGGSELTNPQKDYMEMRSVLAKRSVAENSFNALVGMKSTGVIDENGVTKAQPYLKGILKEFGLSDDAAETMIGKNPSYYAQMEILGKKIYQNPDFYTNLYDKPANVERKQVAMQAVGLMQKFDLFKSYLRHEASLSVLLELAVMDLQSEVENNIGQTDPTGEQIER